MGDFNTPLTEAEKFGGSKIQIDSKLDLANFINGQGLVELDLSGASFTWSNRRVGTDLIQPKHGSRRRFPFRFEKMCLSHPNLSTSVKDWWNVQVDDSVMFWVAKKLRYHNIIAQEETFWRQRSRALWLKDGDKNTRFFHISTLKHRATNRIDHLMKNVRRFDNEHEISRVVDFFVALLKKVALLDLEAQNMLVGAIPKILSGSQNHILVANPSKEDIRSVVFSFDRSKAPCPDGFPMFFFQHFWDVVGEDVSNVVKEFFGARSLLKKLNATFIVLIPKKKGVDNLDAFKPIRLYNSFYKIISKVLTLRLLGVLPLLISPQKNVFVPGRQILDSIIIVHENIHSLLEVKSQGFLQKLDIVKSCDRVDWCFLKKILQAFGFSGKADDVKNPDNPNVSASPLSYKETGNVGVGGIADLHPKSDELNDKREDYENVLGMARDHAIDTFNLFKWLFHELKEIQINQRALGSKMDSLPTGSSLGNLNNNGNWIEAENNSVMNCIEKIGEGVDQLKTRLEECITQVEEGYNKI
ncbi:uncharacterized protein LOC131857544 [Cryptomeria japonica]|uniref:uncharacterized protein LOC131857544 n=1 Tax=Cryptomeria japonica TaxID=3369 RepID=UPI0027DA610E|nr:uncharacterized protein LOC131857544 [Cryptomeria japonica]